MQFDSLPLDGSAWCSLIRRSPHGLKTPKRGVYYTQAQQRLRPDTQSRSLAVGGAQVLYAGPASPINRAIGLGMHRSATSTHLTTIEQFYHNGSVAATWAP
jgi:hypothetical protein